MLEHVPYNETAIQRCPILLDWIKGWAGSDLETLTPLDWYYRGHDLVGGKYKTWSSVIG